MDKEIQLPLSKLFLKNRVVKSALSECLGYAYNNHPREEIINLYSTWSESQASILITGNVQVDKRYMESPANICVSKETMDDKLLARLIQWSK